MTPELAYPLDKIVLKGEWDFLQDIYQQLDVGAELAPNAYPSFVCNRIHKVYDSKVRAQESLSMFMQTPLIYSSL